MPSPEAISVPVANGVICCAAVEGEPCAGSTESWQDTGGATNCSRREHLTCLASVTAVFLLIHRFFIPLHKQVLLGNISWKGELLELF